MHTRGKFLGRRIFLALQEIKQILLYPELLLYPPRQY
jgi:hypothetical protein